ncbi:MAG: 2-oxo acid dehydrogenase subunit E2 [Spirochaetaceae bacterium]|nr:MAG: 2-oxo acid dehydrogenase subunit E2 [Spirochaetaceae bacterium]
MAEQIILPRQGQSVETCLILNWKKKEGEEVSLGEVLVEVETDKAAFEVESTAAGTLLKILHQEGEDVPVLSALAIVGQPGEDIAALSETAQTPAPSAEPSEAAQPAEPAASPAILQPTAVGAERKVAISPRARRAADKSGIAPEQILSALPEGRGSGPRGRILERDVQRVAAQVANTARAASVASAGEFAPAAASAPVAAVAPAGTAIPAAAGADFPGPVREIPVKGIRKIIAERMHASLQESAQYTLHASTSAEALLAYRQKLKASPEERALQAITINDLLNYAVTRTLLRFPAVNSHFFGDKSLQFERVHLAIAVDTPRGLMVPVIRNASLLSLKQMASEAARLRKACLESTVSPDELNGGTFTISNMGTLGIEGFTPVLNPPQVAILGVGSIQLKPVEREGEVVFERFMSLSLTANHQILDGAPAAGFLKELCRALESFELLLAG